MTRSTDVGTGALVFGALVLAGVGGAVVSRSPLMLAPIAAIAAVAFLIALGEKTEHVFIIALAVLLFGFLFQGRAFAYVGLPPLFVSEAVLSLGIAAAVLSRVRLRYSALIFLILGFILLGIVRTLPYVSEFGVMAIRDAALWYYSLFALLVGGFLTRDRLLWFMKRYVALLPLLVVVYVFMPATNLLLGNTGLRLPGSDMLIPSEIKPGDRAVFLAGFAVFISARIAPTFKIRFKFSETLFWLLWLASVATVMVQNRGGLLALVVAVGAVQLLAPSRSGFRVAALGVILISFFLALNPTIDFGGSRTLSPDQLIVNVTSIFSDQTNNIGSVQGTREWRLDWWGEIVEDTVGGPLTLNGRGFGVNLADEYGFQVYEDGSLRSPHNSHITVLARMGIPGVVLWVFMQATFAYQMIRSYIRARRVNLVWAPVLVWLLAMWLAAMVNTSFDVYLEGPQGAVPFWCVFGAGMAVMNWVREEP